MSPEVEVEVGIPDYYRDDLLSLELESMMDLILTNSQELGMTPEHYACEFLTWMIVSLSLTTQQNKKWPSLGHSSAISLSAWSLPLIIIRWQATSLLAKTSKNLLNPFKLLHLFDHVPHFIWRFWHSWTWDWWLGGVLGVYRERLEPHRYHRRSWSWDTTTTE